MALSPAKPAATDVVAHAALQDVGAHVGSSCLAAVSRLFQSLLSRKIYERSCRVRPAIHALISDVSSRQNSPQILRGFG
jgi:hypothetical protein